MAQGNFGAQNTHAHYCCQEDKHLPHGKGPHVHPLSHLLFFFLPQNTNHKLHGRQQTQGKKYIYIFKIKILQYYVFIQEYSHIFSVITTNWKSKTKKPYGVAFSLYTHQESFIYPLLRSW